MSDADLADIGIQMPAEQQVLNLAKLAHKAGLDGVVCSAQEARMLKSALGESFKLVTPGIRPANSATDDQKRVMTPKEAVLAGVDYMVIGRPITRSENPTETVAEILASIRE
jgi:orotidine-5'-phosphate decarboxylase